MFYIFILIAIIEALLSKKELSTQYRYSLFVIVSILALCSFRAPSVCVDTQHYIDTFNSGLLEERFGILYELIYKFCIFMDLKAQGFLAIMALITYVPILYLLKKCNSPALLALVFILNPAFFMESFNLIRQMAAVMYLLLAYYFIYNRKVKIAIIPVVTACLLHSIAVIVIPFLFINKIKIPVKLARSSIIITFLCGLSLTMTSFGEFLSQVALLLPNNEVNSVGHIFNHYVENDELIGEWGLVGMLVNTLPLTILSMVAYNEKLVGNYYYNILFIGTVLLNIFVSSAFCVRISSFFVIAELLYIPHAYSELNKKTKKMFWGCLLLMFIIYIRELWGYHTDPMSLGILPYKFCFE